MRRAPVIAMFVAVSGLCMTSAGCPDDGPQASLAQVDTRPGPLPDDGPDVNAPDAADSDDTLAGDGTQVDAGDDTLDVDVGPVACTTDGECGASACKLGRCATGNCVFDPAPPGTACDDGNRCTPDDSCQGGLCAGSGQVMCNDQDPCTDDRCTPSIGCDFAPKSCDDGDACTNDACRPGVGCVATPLTCAPATDTCSTSVCEPAVGCTTVAAADGTACDDGRVCTVDACRQGTCVGSASGCDDANPCTGDACLPEGGCDFVPIVGCANDDSCLGRLAGAACDDADPGTSADMCISGNCRGYALTRIHGTTVAAQQGLVVTELDDGPEGWSAVLWTINLLGNQSYLLAGMASPAAPKLHGNTVQGARIAGLRDGFAGDSEGRLWRLDGGNWSSDSAWDDALGASGRDVVNAIFTVHGAGVGAARSSLAWIVGGDQGEWLRLCKQNGGNVVCSGQILGSDEGGSVPRALAGVPSCSAAGDCTGAALVVGADAWLGGGFNYNDVYENPTGLAATWQPGYLPDAPGNRATRAVAAWADEAGQGQPFEPSAGGLRALIVGDNGYLLLRRGDGSWHGPLGLIDGQGGRDFSGVWVGAGVVIASAQRLGSNGSEVVCELWVAPRDGDLERGNSWVIHELGRYPVTDSTGIYDIAGRTDGEVRVSGGVRRATGLLDWLDGAVWVRSR